MSAQKKKKENSKSASIIFSDRILVIVFSLIAFAVRLIFLLKAQPAWGYDDERYIFLAKCLSALDFQNAIHYHYPPFSPFLVMLFSAFTHNFESSARLVSILSSALTIIPLYFLSLHIFNQRVAVLTAGFFSLRFFQYSASDLADWVEMLIIYLALLSGFFAIKKLKAKGFFLTGILFGLAFLTKPEAWAFFLWFLFLTMLSGLELFWKGRKKKPEEFSQISFLKLLRILFLLVLGYFLVSGFYLALYYRDTGRFSVNPKAKTLFIHHNLYNPRGIQYFIAVDKLGYYTPGQRVMEGDKIPPEQSVLEILWKNRDIFPSIYSKRFKKNLSQWIMGYFLKQIAGWFWPLLLLLGILPITSLKRARSEFYLHSFGLLPIFLVPLFSGEYYRFFYTMVPWFMLILGRGTERILALLELGLKRFIKTTLFSSLALLVIILTLSVIAVVQTVNSQRDKNYWAEVEYRRQVAELLKQMLPKGCRFMAEAENQSLWYLAGFSPQRQVILPMNPFPEVVFYAKQVQAKYLVFHPSSLKVAVYDEETKTSLLKNRFYWLEPLLEPNTQWEGVRRVFRGKSPTGNIYVIYEFESVKCGN